MSSSVKRAVLKAFKQRGYVVQVGAIEPVIAGFEAAVRDEDDGGEDDDEGHTIRDRLTAYLDRVIGAVSAVQDDSSMLTSAVTFAAVERVHVDLERERGSCEGALELIDIFTVPLPLRSRRTLHDRAGGGCGGAHMRAVVDAKPSVKADLFRTRYELLHGKTLRNPRFTPPSSSVVLGGAAGAGGGKVKGSPYLQLTAIDSLRGTRGDRLVLGMLTELEEGSWFLEDLNGSVEVDLSEAHVTPGMHTESSFVIAQGRLLDDDEVGGDGGGGGGGGEKKGDVEDGARPIFKVFAMGTPPMEERSGSIQALGKDVANLFGGRSYSDTDEAAIAALEKEAVETMFVVFSDVFLDNPRVIAGLRLVFEGFLEDGNVPTAIILMGAFLSHPFGQCSSDPLTLTNAFTALGEMIAVDFPQLATSTTFVIIPGPADAGPGNILPRPPLPAMLTAGFVAALSEERVKLGSNPCRLRYMTQEIVMFREDLLHKMLRSCAVAPNTSDTAVMSEHMIKSVVDQAHLCPLPLASRPVLWAHDHALWLFPSPHLVVVADKVDGYNFTYGNTIGMNPGSFGSDLSFATYALADRKCQQCSLDPTELADPPKDEEEEDDDEQTLGQRSDEELSSEEKDEENVVIADNSTGTGPADEDEGDNEGDDDGQAEGSEGSFDDGVMVDRSYPPPGQLDGESSA